MNRQAIVRAALLVSLVAFVCVCQFVRPAWRVGHDEVRLLPVQDWGFGAGYWDGVSTGGRIYRYGPVERTTNIYP